MLRAILNGCLAGAIGTLALNGSTYLDMVVRGRGASSVPADTAHQAAQATGIDLTGSDGEQAAANRSQGLGALLGYANGLGVGAGYGALQSRTDVPTWIAAPALGIISTAATDIPTTALGVTDPSDWEPRAWAEDVLFHLIYGAATAAACAYLDRG